MCKPGFGRGLFAILVLAFLVPAGQAAPNTLREVLSAQKVPVADPSLPNLDKPITSYQVLNDKSNFLIAYYLDDGSGTIQGPLFISRFDRAAGQWQSGEISRATLEQEQCTGSAYAAWVTGDRIYITLHLNPSASCTLALSRNLAVQRVLNGWIIAAFEDGRVVYHNNEVHFAPVHEGELSIFNPRADQEFKIYPRKPFQSIRTTHIEKLRAFYSHNQDWCDAHNDPCDPESFNSDVISEVTTSDKTDSLAFVAQFENTSYWDETERTKLQAFRETGQHLREDPGASPDALLSYFFSDLGRIGRLKLKPAVIDLFSSDAELHEFVAAAFEAKESSPKDLQSFAQKFGPEWAKEPLRKKFLQAIETEPEFTFVLYVYRNLSHPDAIEYREMLVDDWKARFGDAPRTKALEADNLRQIFEH